jgi:CubicO group peptidase (beta-lactamase class C family)
MWRTEHNRENPSPGKPALLGYLLGEAAQVPYQRLVEERICRPLTMTATSFDASPVQGYSGRKVPPWHPGPMPAAGGRYSTARDMAKLLTACLRPQGTSLAESAPLALATHAVIGPREERGSAGITPCAMAGESAGTTG